MRTNIILDTNTFLSAAIFPNSITRKAYLKAVQFFQLALSSKTFGELEEVLSRPKFDKYLSLEDRQGFVEFIRLQSTFIEPTETITDCRDPKDNKFLEIAVAALAPIIITDDLDLLVLHPFRGILILKSSDFLMLDMGLEWIE